MILNRIRAIACMIMACFALMAMPTARAEPLPAPPSGDIQIQFNSLEPAVISPGQTLRITATITNATSADVNPTAILYGNSRASMTRLSIANWYSANPNGRVGIKISALPLGTIPVGHSVPVVFEASAEQLNITSTSAWGPRGLALTVEQDGQRLAIARTFSIQEPSIVSNPIGLTVMAAVTGPPRDPTSTNQSALVTATAPDGRLGRLLNATQAFPQVSWAVDPMLVADALDVAGATPWATTLLAAQSGRYISALPADDLDLAAYAHHQTAPVPIIPPHHPETHDLPWRQDILWPADPTPDMTTISWASQRDARLVVVADGLHLTREIPYTPSGIATLDMENTHVSALLVDPTLTSTLAGQTAAPGIDTTQRMLAETAALAQERPNQVREFLVALDRTWEPDPATFTATMTALQSAPWVRFSNVDQLSQTTELAAERTPLPLLAPASTEIPAGELASLTQSQQQLSQFAVITEKPEQLVAPLNRAVASLTSIAYRNDPSTRSRLVKDVNQSAYNTSTSSITMTPRDSVRLLAKKMDFPVIINNELDQPVTVQLVLNTPGDRVVQTDIPTVIIPAQGKISTQIPVKVIASGSATVIIRAKASSRPPGGGIDVAQPSRTTVLLSPELDTAGMWIAITGVLALFMAGVWRTIRRGQSPHRTTHLPDSPPSG